MRDFMSNLEPINTMQLVEFHQAVDAEQQMEILR
jgi:hypothetical protein